MQECIDKTIAWAQVNSYFKNLEGIHEISQLLIEDFLPFSDTFEMIETSPIPEVTPQRNMTSLQLGPILHFQKNKEAKTQLLFVGHMDTVYPKEMDMPILLQDNQLFGPGVADMKGGLALLLAALPHLPKTVGYEIVINADEEIGSPTSASFIQERGQGKTLALVFEPRLPCGSYVSTRPSSNTFSIVVTGKSAHVGRNPDEGKSALFALSDLLYQLSFLASPEKKQWINVGIVQGGTAANTVPEKGIAKMNVRTHSLEQMQELIQVIEVLIVETEQKYGVTIDWVGHSLRGPKTHHPLVAHLPLSFKPTGGVTDGNSLSSLGIPVIDTMGPIGNHLHSKDEVLFCDSFTSSYENLFVVLDNFL